MIRRCCRGYSRVSFFSLIGVGWAARNSLYHTRQLVNPSIMPMPKLSALTGVFTAALALATAAVVFAGDTQSAPQLHSLKPPVLLPDGAEFKTWELPLKFTRTYYVDTSHPAASDANPGTKQRPFATINRAAKVLQPGERVVVAGGVYRERIKPARGGAGPDQMISYEAEPGATVVIKGSRVFKPQWQPVRRDGQETGVWQAGLDPQLFDGYNPFAIENVTPKQFESMDWATPLRGKVPFTLPRGLVFQDGKRLTQVAAAGQLTSGDGVFYVDRASQVLHVRPYGSSAPGQAAWEITTQETVFAPEQTGLGFIRVKGFTIEHSAGPWPWEQVGAISTWRGHHWIIEENTVRWVNGVGIDVGSTHPRLPQPEQIGFHIVRRNTVTDCGICGICGLGPGRGREFGLLIEDNVLARNSFFDVETLFELAAIKTHNNIRCLIRRNLILETRHGAGIWMDWDNRFSRCTQNVIVGTRSLHGGIFVEASFEPNLVDQNFIWDTDGRGIYEHDSCNQIFAHNFIGRSTRAGLHLHGKMTDRRISGRPIVGGHHTVLNNILVSNQGSNVFRGEPSEVAGNLSENITATFDPATLELTWSFAGEPSSCRPVPGITHDFWERVRKGAEVTPGPFGELPRTATVVKLGTKQ